ncbi:MAG: MFS transporter [Anaerolineales bacterium]|nr:MFS transporter [Anaerolineales bacterium]MCB8951054.1 MFS transporter [Ardenticatenales bacterium]
MFKLPPIPRADGVTNRQVFLGLGARFFDELLSGLPDVLMPTMRVLLGLSFTQISLLSLVLNYVAAIVEPINGLLIDMWPRRRLLAWGAFFIGVSTMLVGLAPTFALLVVAYGVYGLGSGPLAHTGDVVLVEAHPAAPDRIFARATLLDTMGALLGPALVTFTFWLHFPWRWLLLSLGASSLVYAFFLLRTRFPVAAGISQETEDGHGHMLAGMRANLRTVLTHPAARYWLLFSLAFDLLETPFHFQTVWLAEEVGLSQALVGVFRVLEMVVGMVSLLALDRWRQRASARQVLRLAAAGVALLFPAWLFIPGIWPRFLLMVPLMFLLSMFWPIVRAQSLACLPGRAGAMTAALSLLGLLPLTLLLGLLADRANLPTAMFTGFAVGMASIVLLLSQGAGNQAVWAGQDDDNDAG